MAGQRRNWLLCRELCRFNDCDGAVGRMRMPSRAVSRQSGLSGTHHRPIKEQAGSYGDS